MRSGELNIYTWNCPNLQLSSLDSLGRFVYKARRRCRRGTNNSCSASLQLQRRTTESADGCMERWSFRLFEGRNSSSFDVVLIALHSNCHGTNHQSNAVDLVGRTWVFDSNIESIPCCGCFGSVLRNLFHRPRTRCVAVFSGRRACGYTTFTKCWRVLVHCLVDIRSVPNATKRSSSIPDCPAILYRMRRFMLRRLVLLLRNGSDAAPHR